MQTWVRLLLRFLSNSTFYFSIFKDKEWTTFSTKIHPGRVECWPHANCTQKPVVAFEPWCWRLLRVPWTARRSNQSILKEISPKYSLGGLILKLKLQSFGYLVQRTDSLEKTLSLGKIEGRRRRGWHRMRWLDGVTDLMDMSLSKFGSWGWTGKPGVLRFMGSQRVRHDCATELNWSWGKVKINTMPIHRAKETCNWDFNPEGSDSWAWALNTCYSAANL